MTNDELTELERLAAEATPGSWKGDEGIAHWGADGYNLRPANAAFIAAARTAVPALIASLREARSEQRLAVDNASVLMRQRSDAMQASDEMARINSALRAELKALAAGGGGR